MMFVLECSIEILHGGKTQVRFDYCNEIEVQTSCSNLTDTAVVKVPRKMRWKGRPITDYVSRNDRISIRMGYRGHGIEKVFEGYVNSVENSTDIVIRCENSMRLFKTIDVKAEVIPHFDIVSFLKRYAPEIEVVCPDSVNFGEVVVKEGTLAGFLDGLKSTFPWFHGFFIGNTLHVMFRYAAIGREVAFDPERNQISDSLKYILAEDEKVAVKAVRILDDNSRIEVIVPSEADDNYSRRTIYSTSAGNVAELKQEAEKFLSGISGDRMEGNITAFGIPYVRKGDVVRLRDRIRTERNGKRFFAEGVKYTFGRNGYRQTITLGTQL